MSQDSTTEKKASKSNDFQSSGIHRSRILIIDDHLSNLTSIKQLLLKMIPDLDIETASSGAEGFKKTITFLPDTILLDIQLPDLDGYKVCQKIKEHSSVKNIPIIFLTGIMTETVDKVKGLKMGGDAYLTKPVDAGELAAQVNVMLRIKKAEDDLRTERNLLQLKVKERTKKLHDSWEKYHSIFENIQDVYFEIKSDGEIIEISPSIQKLTGINREHLIGKPILNLFPNQSAREEIVNTVLTNTVLSDYEVELYGEDDAICYCSMNLKVKQDQGDIRHAVGSLRDVTMRHWAENELNRYREHLEELVEIRTNEVNEKQAQLAHAGRLSSLGEMATGVAHELNQPLAIIKAQNEYFGLLNHKDTEFKKELLEGIDKINEEIERAVDIIDHMRNFARKRVNSKEPIKIKEPIKKATIFFHERFSNQGIKFEIDIPENMPRIIFNPQQLEQIIVNLLSNSLHAVNQKSEILDSKDGYEKSIVIRASKTKSKRTVILEVEDNGIGMTNDQVYHCLDPFYTTKEVGEGTGLGLSIVHGLLMEFGGRLEVNSEEFVGTKMKLFLKIHTD